MQGPWYRGFRASGFEALNALGPRALQSLGVGFRASGFGFRGVGFRA